MLEVLWQANFFFLFPHEQTKVVNIFTEITHEKKVSDILVMKILLEEIKIIREIK